MGRSRDEDWMKVEGEGIVRPGSQPVSQSSTFRCRVGRPPARAARPQAPGTDTQYLEEQPTVVQVSCSSPAGVEIGSE